MKIKAHTNQEIPQATESEMDSNYPTVECLVYGLLDTGYGYGIREWSVLDGNFSNAECDDYGFEMSAVEKWWYWRDIKDVLEF